MFLLSPNEVFAMEPSPDFVTNYYKDKEYIGTDPYFYFHPDPAPNINTIQLRTNNYGTLIKDDWYTDKKGTNYMHSIPYKHGNIYIII